MKSVIMVSLLFILLGGFVSPSAASLCPIIKDSPTMVIQGEIAKIEVQLSAGRDISIADPTVILTLTQTTDNTETPLYNVTGVTDKGGKITFKINTFTYPIGDYYYNIYSTYPHQLKYDEVNKNPLKILSYDPY